MKVEFELTDMFGRVLLRPESIDSLTAMPNVGDMVSIGSKQWEIARRHFHFHPNGELRKVAVKCNETDL